MLSSKRAAALSDAPNESLTMAHDPSALFSELSRAQSQFLQAADAVPSEYWKTSPGDGRWSAAELVAHLFMVERAVIEKADRVSQHPPKQIPFFKKFHIPMALVESRWVRRKSPMPINQETLTDKEAMLARLREVRERSLAFLEEVRNRDLREYYWKHPALGMLNTYGWIRFIAAHEIRHTKQMREIAASLLKSVESLQK